jgi:two-component system nitrogen regulation response regulator GlnG
VAATNRDLKQEVRQGRFRADLYHRLSVFAITVPPLRELGDDRLRLLDHFRRVIAEQFKQPAFRLDAAAEQFWLSYRFPGNVRELRNIVIRLAARHAGRTVTDTDLVEEFDSEQPPLASAVAPLGMADGTNTVPGLLAPLADREARIAYAERHLADVGAAFSLDATLLAWEDAYIEAARRRAACNISHAARLLGINRTTLYNRMDTLARSPAPATDTPPS